MKFFIQLSSGIHKRNLNSMVRMTNHGDRLCCVREALIAGACELTHHASQTRVEDMEVAHLIVPLGFLDVLLQDILILAVHGPLVVGWMAMNCWAMNCCACMVV